MSSADQLLPRSNGLSAPATGEPPQWRRVPYPSTNAKISTKRVLGLSKAFVGGLRWMYLAVVLVRAFRVWIRRVTVEDPENPIAHLIAFGRGKA